MLISKSQNKSRNEEKKDEEGGRKNGKVRKKHHPIGDYITFIA